ncbi:hypothetical protein FIBSPDRAFT_684924, partial [Athelia psychrophila]
KAWMCRQGYKCWLAVLCCGCTKNLDASGQYVDGHEREDVVYHRQSVFLPAWNTMECRMRAWTKDNIEVDNGEGGRRIVVWFHDESTFYANDRRRVRWVPDG